MLGEEIWRFGDLKAGSPPYLAIYTEVDEFANSGEINRIVIAQPPSFDLSSPTLQVVSGRFIRLPSPPRHHHQNCEKPHEPQRKGEG
jgi:hypothetical protein